jgi:hypothetical protein
VPDARDEAQHADAILIGYVTGERYPEYEEHLLRGGSPDTSPLGRRMIRVVLTEALKGLVPAPLEIAAPCAAPFPEIHERVIVVRRAGRDHVTPADFLELEKELRAALASEA